MEPQPNDKIKEGQSQENYGLITGYLLTVALVVKTLHKKGYLILHTDFISQGSASNTTT